LLILILGGKKQYLRSGNRSSAIGAENILQKKVKKAQFFYLLLNIEKIFIFKKD